MTWMLDFRSIFMLLTLVTFKFHQGKQLCKTNSKIPDQIQEKYFGPNFNIPSFCWVDTNLDKRQWPKRANLTKGSDPNRPTSFGHAWLSPYLARQAGLFGQSISPNRARF